MKSKIKNAMIFGTMLVIVVMAAGAIVIVTEKPSRGVLQEKATVVAWQSHSYPDGTNNAGAIIESTGQIESIGRVTVVLSMAYTWDFYGFNKSALLYSYDDGPMVLDDVKDYTDYAGLFTVDHQVIITDKSGDMVVCNIVSGIVREGPSNEIGGTTNEWLISLKIDPVASTGEFMGATGTVLICLIIDSNNIPDILGSKKYISAYEILMHLKRVGSK